jgi:6-pyruvoyl-tetrahydropterin synthase
MENLFVSEVIMSYFTCTKRFSEICVAHRNWNSGTHCALIHGYARNVELTIRAENLDKAQWVIDLGDLKFVRDILTKEWDHRLLVASDDILLDDLRALEAKGGVSLNVMDIEKGWGPGLEGSCQFLYDTIDPQLRSKTNGRCWITKVEIWEKTDNRAALVIE